MRRVRSLSSDVDGSPSESFSPKRGPAADPTLLQSQDPLPSAHKDKSESPTKSRSRTLSARSGTLSARSGSPDKDAKVFNRHDGGVGSPYGSPTKPIFQRSSSWYLDPQKASPEQRRSDKYVHMGYSEKRGTVKHPKRGAVSWNNRWHLTPSMLGQEIHPNYREFFDRPSRMYTSTTEDWRHMYGDHCDLINIRVPGTPLVNPVYGWHTLRLQKDLLRSQTQAQPAPPPQTL